MSESNDNLQIPCADEIAEWMRINHIQKLTLNRIGSRNELKIEASQYAKVALVVRCHD
jgi:hypothetical protein